MSRHALAGLFLFGSVLGCRDVPQDEKVPAFLGATDAAVLDSLASGRPVEVSVAGTVVAPPDGDGVVIEDATGFVRVALPDTISAPPAVPVGTRFLAQGLLRQTPEGPVVDAREWLYDSTAVPVRSP